MTYRGAAQGRPLVLFKAMRPAIVLHEHAQTRPLDNVEAQPVLGERPTRSPLTELADQIFEALAVPEGMRDRVVVEATGQGAHKRASAYHMRPKDACIQCGRLPICSGTYPSVPY